MQMRRVRYLVQASIALVVCFVLLYLRMGRAPAGVTPPRQPATGPGGAECICHDVVARVYGQGAQGYWIFEPAAPRPQQAPLIVFNHGWGVIQPALYGAWINHIVRRGNIVLYPIYQADLSTPMAAFTPNTIAGVKAALQRLQAEAGHVKPDLSRVAFVGHSIGGIITANLAVRCGKAGLPSPKAFMCVEPGSTWTTPVAIKLEDLRAIPRKTLLLTVTGERDSLAGDIDARRIFTETANIPAENKNYVVLLSDTHGQPPLQADHSVPFAINNQYTDPRFDNESANTLSREILQSLSAERQNGKAASDKLNAVDGIDALDFYGTWKLFDGLCDAAFSGKNRRYALGNTPEQRFMGRWSDGVPVKELHVVVKP